MSDPNDNEKIDKLEPPLGQRFAEARKEKQLSIKDVAQRLRLKTTVIESLEADRLDRLEAPTYVRGYIRSYATLLGLEAEALVDAYNQRLGETPGTISLRQAGSPIRRTLRVSSQMLAAVALIILVIIGLWLLWPDTESGDTPKAPGQDSTTPAQTSTGPLTGPLTGQAPAPEAPRPTAPEAGALGEAPASTAFEQTPAAMISDTDTPAPASDDNVLMGTTPNTATAASDQVVTQQDAQASDSADNTGGDAGGTLTLVFEQQSWVEVRNAQGKLLLFRMAQPGARHSVRGAQPLQVLLGNSPHVQVIWNGEIFDQSRYNRGNVARFKLGPDPARQQPEKSLEE